MASIDDFTPRYTGDLSRPLLVTFTDHEGNLDDLTGASNFVLHLQNTVTQTVATGAGVWTILNQTTNKGQATYAWAAADVANAGFFTLAISATMPDGPAHWDYRVIQFIATF